VVSGAGIEEGRWWFLPHWNASLGQHQGLCRGISKLGDLGAAHQPAISRLQDAGPSCQRADYAVSSNLARTDRPRRRQAVIDVRCCLDWFSAAGL